MAVCGHCGAPLQGDERFCVVCGAAVAAAAPAAAVPVAVAAAAPVSYVAAAPVQVAGTPGAYAAGGVPVVVGAPAAPAKGRVWMWVAIAALLVGGYYYAKNKPAASQTAPAAPAQPPAPAQPITSGPVLQAQVFSGHWQAIYGFVEVTNTRWTNNANVAMQSAALECDQYSANGSLLSQMRTTLNGPVQPGAFGTFNPFQMGSVSTYMTRVNCFIVAVTPVN